MRVAMVSCQPLLLAALTVTTGLLGMGCRGLQLTDSDPPSQAVGLESPSQQVLQEEGKRGIRIESKELGDDCGDPTPSDAKNDFEQGKETLFNITKEEPSDGRSPRLQVSKQWSEHA